MREAAWVVLLAVVVVFVMLVALEVGKRSTYRSPVDLAADVFTKTNVRNVEPAPSSTSSLMTNVPTTTMAAEVPDVDMAS
jgi:hypothetical protein